VVQQDQEEYTPLGEASRVDGTLESSLVIDESILDAPYRRSADRERAALAVMIADLLYPRPSDSLGLGLL
jgi:hypothetical protein